MPVAICHVPAPEAPVVSVSGPSPARTLFLTFSFVLLLIPALICRQALQQTETRLQQQAESDAQSACWDMLKLLRLSALPRLLLEERLDGIVERIGSDYAVSTGKTHLERLQQAVRLNLAHDLGLETTTSPLPLAGETSPPASGSIFTAIGIWSHFPDIASDTRLSELVYSGFSRADASILYQMAQQCIQNNLSVFNDTPDEGAPDSFADRFNRIFSGLQQSMFHLTSYLRGSIVPVKFQGRNCWLFWQILLDHRHLPELDVTKMHIHPGMFSEQQNRSIFRGIILALMPEISPTDVHPARVIQTLDESKPAVAFLDENRRIVALTPAFEREPLKSYLCESSSDIPSGWSIASGTVFFDRPYLAIIASPHRPLPGWWVFKERLISIGLLLAVLIGSVTIFQTILNQGLLIRHLTWQLCGGLFLAALIPLSLTFRLTEEYFQQRFSILEQQLRRSLVSLFTEREQQFSLCATALKNRLPELIRSSKVSQLLNEHVAGIAGEKSPPTPTADQVQLELRRQLLWFHPPPLESDLFECYPHLLCAVSWADISFYAGLRESAAAMNALPLFFRLAAGALLYDLNPDRFGYFQQKFSEPTQPQRTSIGDLRKEEMQRFGTAVMCSIFGEDSVLKLIKAPTDVLSMLLGADTMDMFQILVPDDTAPEQIFYVFTNTRTIEQRSQRRVLGTKTQGNARMFTQRSSRPGFFVMPQTGERFPFLRPIARRIMYTKVPYSSRIEYDGETYLVEGQPGTRGNNFIYLGVIPFSEHLQNEQRLQNLLQLSLFLVMACIFFLALNGTVTFLQPVQSLSRALEDVAAGDFNVRLSGERRDEIGALHLAFNRMTRSLQEREMLGQMVSVSARRAVESATAEARAAEGYRLEVLIMYINIPDFATVRSRTAPDDLMAGLQRQVRVISRMIHKAGGSIDKIMGEKLLAVFPHSADLDLEQHRRQIVTLLCTLQTSELRGELPYPLAVGVVLGTVIAGLLGSGKRRDFTVIGSSVNLAARLASHAETFSESRFLATPATSDFIGRRMPQEHLGELALKGFQEKTPICRLRPDRIDPDHIGDDTTPVLS